MANIQRKYIERVASFDLKPMSPIMNIKDSEFSERFRLIRNLRYTLRCPTCKKDFQYWYDSKTAIPAKWCPVCGINPDLENLKETNKHLRFEV